MQTIKGIKAREILDSRGTPTVEAEVFLSEGIWGRASVPSGASTGSYEALERRDNVKNRFWGSGVQNVVNDIENIIEPALIGKNVLHQDEIDKIMISIDGTPSKSKLGANAILAVSLAAARAAANLKKIPLYRYLNESDADFKKLTLPMPLVNVLNGGAHADNNIDIQEFMIVPTGANNFSNAIRMCAEVFKSLKNLLKQSKLNTNVGDEGGVAPNLQSTREVFDYLVAAIEKAGYIPGKDIKFALDIAATELYKNGKYQIEDKILSSTEMIDYYEKLISEYPIISIEDGLGEDDWEGWKLLTNRLGKKIQLVGDDLFVTNPLRFSRGLEESASNAILVKLNQIGSLSETLSVIKMAKKNNWNSIISHRSGETEDTFIADLATAVSSGQIKTGSTSRGERIAKYNQLIRIEQDLGKVAEFSSFGRA